MGGGHGLTENCGHVGGLTVILPCPFPLIIFSRFVFTFSNEQKWIEIAGNILKICLFLYIRIYFFTTY